MKSLRLKLGYTLLELLVVMGIVAVIAAVSMPAIQSQLGFIYHQHAIASVLDFLSRAQLQSMLAVQNETWGVCSVDSSLLLYRGSCALENAQQQYSLPTQTQVLQMPDIHFSSTGEIDMDTLSFLIQTGSREQTLQLNRLGVVHAD